MSTGRVTRPGRSSLSEDSLGERIRLADPRGELSLTEPGLHESIIQEVQSSQEVGSEESEEERNTSGTEVFAEDSFSFEEENVEEDAETPRMPRPALTIDQVHTLVDPEELQRLLKEQMELNSTLSQNKKNERSGVLLKAEPPDLDDSEDYGVWKKKLTVWRNATGMTDKQQAACVVQGIKDDHKHHKKGLSTLLMGTLSDTDVENLTMDKVINFLDGQLLVSNEEKTFEAYVDFIDCTIKAGEKY